MTATAVAIGCPSGAEAQGTRQPIDIAPAALPAAIAELSREAQVSIGAEGVLPQIATPAVRGTLSVEQALARLLARSGLVARKVGPRAWRIERGRAAVPAVTRPPRPIASPALPVPETRATEDIVVTATKRPQRLSSLPLAISVVSLSDPRRHDAASGSAAVAGEIEGMALSGPGPGRNHMYLRGVADSPFGGESQSTVAVLLDDARVTYAAPDPDIRLVDVERVEVIKGPQGSLYGTGALGGIYRIVTRRADPDAFEATVSSGGSATRSGGLGHSAAGIVNLPLASNAAALRLTGYSGSEGGWVDSGARKDGNQTRVLGARVGLGLVPADDWRIDVTGFAQWLQSRDSQYVYAAHASHRPAQLAEPHDNDLRHLSFRAARDGGDGPDIVATSGMTWHEVGDTLDATIGAESFGLAHPLLLEDERAYRVWDSELRVSDRIGAVSWLAGISHVRARQTALWTLTGSDGSATIDDDRRMTWDSALFGKLSLDLGGGVTIDGGGRVFHTVVRETRRLPDETVSRRLRKSGFTPDLSLSWHPREGRLFYMRYGTAFRLGGSDIGPSGALETLDGDELATIEAGWRETTASGGQIDVGAWYTRWTDLQSDILQPNGLIETENAGDGRILGAEASLELPIARRWRVLAGANYTRARLVHSRLGFESDDRHLPVVPEYMLRGGLEHDFAFGPADGAVKLQLRYVGPARLSFDPVLDRPMGRTLDARVEASARLGGLNLWLTIDNLIDRRDDSFAYGNPLRFRTMRQFTPQAPRRIAVGVSHRW